MRLNDMVIMPSVDYQNTCDAIREKTGTSDPIKSGQLAAFVDAVYTAGSEAKLYVGQVRGSGTSSLSFEVPFEPDYVFVLPTDPYACNTPNSFITFCRDFKTFARIGGVEVHFIDSSQKYYTNSFTNKSIENYISYADGVLTYTPPSAISSYTWQEESLFTIIAFKYVLEGKSDEDLLKEYILSLPEDGSGEVTISTRRFEETGMTEDAFNEFVQANRPNWTFTME